MHSCCLLVTAELFVQFSSAGAQLMEFHGDGSGLALSVFTMQSFSYSFSAAAFVKVN